jgi:hypothetical protein
MAVIAALSLSRAVANGSRARRSATTANIRKKKPIMKKIELGVELVHPPSEDATSGFGRRFYKSIGTRWALVSLATTHALQ